MSARTQSEQPDGAVPEAAPIEGQPFAPIGLRCVTLARPIAIIAAIAAMLVSVVALPNCRGVPSRETPRAPAVGSLAPRVGDEIMVAGVMVHTGAPVVLWTDPGGYDAYRVERRFAPPDESDWDDIAGAIPSPNRFGLRRTGLDEGALERVRGGGWTLTDLQRSIDQIVLHYDASGTSRQCFKILHDRRGLSAHFLIDLDGTIYQTLDVKERAWHATRANSRSVGIEIAHIGAYETVAGSPLETWYQRDRAGYRVALPSWMGDGGVRTPGFVARPSRDRMIEGEINGRSLIQPDFTDEQYDALARLTAALCTVLPRIECAYPTIGTHERGDRASAGAVLPHAMSDDAFAAFRGILGHWHVQENKADPGPAMDWERVVGDARRLISGRD